MRCVIHITLPVEKFNQAVADGTAGEKIQRILEDAQPEAMYFTATGGRRGGYMVVDVAEASEIPRYAEPWFLQFDAQVEIHPCMTPEDLGAAGLDELGRRWS